MKRLLPLIVLLYSVSSYGQQFTGLFEDNYTGSTSMLINPASPVTDPHPWEVNLFSAGVFLDNNYVYYDQQSIVSVATYLSANKTNPENFSFFNRTNTHINGNLFAQGPSAYFHLNDFCFGIFTDERAEAGVKSSSAMVGLNNLFTVPYNESVTVPKLSGSYMYWAEFGVNASTLLIDNGLNKLYAGAAIKYLGGINAANVVNNEAFTFTRNPDSDVSSTPVNMSYSYTINNLNSPIPSFIGRGVGMDLGVVYVVGEVTSNKQLYDWKVMGSLNDIGGIGYTAYGNNFKLQSNSNFAFPDTAFVHVNRAPDLDGAFSQIVYGNTTASQNGTRFALWMPMSITLNADRSLGSGFYIDAAISHRIPLSDKMVYSANMESLSPRFESKWFAVVVPFVLYEQQDFHLGTSIRLGPLTIGTDDLLSFVSKGKLAGADAYIGLRIFPFKTSFDKTHKKSDKQECPPTSDKKN